MCWPYCYYCYSGYFESHPFFSIINLFYHLYYYCKLLKITKSIIDGKLTNLRQIKTIFLPLSFCFLCYVCCTYIWVCLFLLPIFGSSTFSSMSAMPVLYLGFVCYTYIRVFHLFYYDRYMFVCLYCYICCIYAWFMPISKSFTFSAISVMGLSASSTASIVPMSGLCLCLSLLPFLLYLL